MWVKNNELEVYPRNYARLKQDGKLTQEIIMEILFMAFCQFRISLRQEEQYWFDADVVIEKQLFYANLINEIMGD